MKPIALVAFILILVAMIAAEDIHSRMENIHEECQADPVTKINHGVMEKFFGGEKVDEDQFARHALCMNKKIGLQKENGDVDKDALRKIIEHNDKLDEAVEECGQKKGTAEETALALLKCIKKYRPSRTP